jgi:hypothetical protein
MLATRMTTAAALWTIPFDQPLQCYTEAMVNAGTVFMPGIGAKVPGATVICRVLGNGRNLPVFQGFQELNDSAGFDGRDGVLNLIQFRFDGVDCWYTIAQAKVLQRATYPIALQFLSRTEGIVQEGSTYQADDLRSVVDHRGGQFEQYMASSQSIPAGKDGQITVCLSHATMVGFKATAQAEPHATWRYKVWPATTTYYCGTDDRVAIDTGVRCLGQNWLRLSRQAGVIRAEAAPDGQTWTLVQEFSAPSSEALYIAAALTPADATTARSFKVMGFEVAA